MSESYVERLHRMSPAELEAEAAKARARYERTRDALDNGRPIPRDDAVYVNAREPMRAVIRKDRTGREITEFQGGSMDDWMGQFKAPILRQIKICKDDKDFLIENLYQNRK
jgi:hypothetical protein